MITLEENTLTVSDYLKLRECVGWKRLGVKQAENAIKGSLYIVTAYDDDKLVGMGRIVGDGAVISYIQDLIIIPEVQRNGVGSMIIEKLKTFAASLKSDGNEMMLCLMCALGREEFYKKHGFIARPTENLGPGMIQYIKM